MSFDTIRMTNLNFGHCIGLEFQGVNVHLIISRILFCQVRGCFLLCWCLSLFFVVLARAVPCPMSLTTAGKTGSPLWFFGSDLLGFYIELFFGLWLLLFGGSVLLYLSIGSCSLMNRVYSFRHCNNCVDVFFASVLDFDILA